MTNLPLAETLGIVVCLVLSAVFSGSETTLTALSQTRTRQLLESGGRPAAVLRRWLEEPSAWLTSILIGNNIVNVAASALATSVAQQVLGEWAGQEAAWVSPLAVAVGVMTLLLLVFGEITPKTLARAHHERLAVVVLYVLTPWYVVSWPVTRVFMLLSNRVGRWTNTELDGGAPHVREEDIEYLVRLGREEGSISSDRERMLRSVFEFTDTTAREVMVPRTDVVALPRQATGKEVLEVVLDAGHSRLPVYDGSIDNIVGLFYAKDLLRLISARPIDADFDLRRSLRQANFVPETKLISELLREMQENRIHMAIVVDEFGGFAGIVTLEDIMEEFFGDILDEYDVESDWLEEGPDGRWRVDARINMEELGEVLGITIEEEEDIDTLGGYLTKELGEVPRAGAVVDAWGLRMVIEEADARRVRRVLIERQHETSPEVASSVASSTEPRPSGADE